jgi:hypothetical protein
MKSVKPQAPVATNVRIPAHLREAIAKAAAREHRSLGNYLLVAAMERLAATTSR